MAEDTAGEGVSLAIGVVSPATAAADGVKDTVVVTTLAVEPTVEVTAGLLLATELWVACVTFCEDTGDTTSCAVFAFTGEAPAN